MKQLFRLRAGAAHDRDDLEKPVAYVILSPRQQVTEAAQLGHMAETVLRSAGPLTPDSVSP